MLVIIIGSVIIVVGILLHLEEKRGLNRISGLGALLELSDKTNKTPVTSWGTEFKNTITQLGSHAFNKFKVRGVRPAIKHELVASRGYDKLKEIITATRVRPRGKVLSLCCGRGGWEQVYAGSNDVTHIDAVTFGAGPGHEGHENFTDKYFPGKEKVKLHLGDATTYPKTTHDTLLFDGGESHPDFTIEAGRFNRLLSLAVARQISPATKNFVIKVLTPTHPETLEILRRIQSITNKGSFYRPTVCKNSTMEMYFVSTKPCDLTRAAGLIIKEYIRRGIENRKLEKRKRGPGYSYAREEITSKPVKLLEQLDMGPSIDALGEPLAEQGRTYNHWETLGVYPVGVSGSSGQKYNKYGVKCASRLIPTLPGFHDWKLTDTSPEAFIRVFNAKVDTSPKENHKYEKEVATIYRAAARFFREKRQFRIKELSWEELEKQANKQGAPGMEDIRNNINSVGDFLQLPDWKQRVEACRRALREGRPIGAIFNTMGKREKKSTPGDPKGSRMIAYLGIAMRLLEMKLFGNMIKLTKKENNRFGVGGLGLHDLGERIREVWLGNGTSDDIAGFDTRVGLYTLSCESEFVKMLGGSEDHEAMYRLYGFPHIMIPIPSEFRRSQLLAGRGQRMSGTQVTYPMNTITRIVFMILQYAVSKGVAEDKLEEFTMRCFDGKEDIAACCSGDDIIVSSAHDIGRLASTGHVLDEVGMIRKNMQRDQVSPVAHTIEEVEFCSHSYEEISFYDVRTGVKAKRYMPTRTVTEIVAKSLLRVGGSQEHDMDSQAWLSAQGNNLCVMYPHLRTCRALGLAYKSVVNPNVVLTQSGGTLRPRPWMREGKLLEVLNVVLFGESTSYPVEGFEVQSWSHVGYMNPKREVRYDPECFTKRRSLWRACLFRDVQNTIYEYGTGGDTTPLEEWRTKRLI